MKEQAKSSTLLFLKRYAPTDERTVNRLFVSAFIDSNGMVTPKSAFLSKYCIRKFVNILEMNMVQRYRLKSW